jgi:methanogenic corrinoid protein MtbC1
MSNDIYDRLKNSVIAMDTDAACEAVEEGLSTGLDPIACIDAGLARGMKEVSDMFDRAEVFVPQIILSTETFSAAVAILTKNLPGGKPSRGKVIVHTVTRKMKSKWP